MLNLDEQINNLVKAGPDYGVPAVVMQQAVAPVLKQLAKDLSYAEYYLCQNSQEDWLITTIQNRDQTDLEKKVIYAFSNEVDALQMQHLFTEDVSVATIPVAELIFQLFALKTVDSIIFMDIPGNLYQGKEITKQSLFDLFQIQLEQFRNNLA